MHVFNICLMLYKSVLQGPQNFRTQALASLIVSVYKDHGKVNTEVNLPYMKTFDGVGLIFTTIIVIGVSLSKPHIDHDKRGPKLLVVCHEDYDKDRYR